MDGERELALHGIGRRYGVRAPWVLRDVALTAPPGTLLRVEGANGSGKSTLLRIAAGVDRPSTGVVTGRPADRTAYVPERFPPALPFPALRYLTRIGAVRGLTAADARVSALHWLDRFGITGYASTPLDELSKGTCQKIAVAQALLADPALLVLDEAWTGLDAAAREVLDAAVQERVAAGAVVLFVDHDPLRLAAATTAALVLPPRPDAGSAAPAPVPVPSAPAPAAGPADPAAPGAGLVVIEAAGGGDVALESGEASRAADTLRVVVTAGESDGVLRTLLAARPPWHVTGVRTLRGRSAQPAPATPRLDRGSTGAAARAAALLRYQAELVLRSHRWLPPFLFYGAVMAIGIAGGQPLLGSLGYAAALLLPVAAWTVRVCVTTEPPAARACVASAVGTRRAQAGALLTALLAAGALGAVGTLLVTAVSGAHSDDQRTAVPVGAALVAGLMAAAVSVLLGTAVGALTNPPVVRGGGWSVLGTVIAAGAVLITSGSPAQAAVTGLVKGSRTGTVHYPVLALGLSLLAAAAAAAVSAARPPARHT
ncbi:ATP-binding cassette domain-containing protein [Streptomyces sp. V4-01]|uniref:ATP-binding cassette domain-containing protein n=1 Tax=Actinacidiphila polyblastidii TaxID=3110430 RepID=A0ABU7P9P7_9ACTN|nr:ATP-binding cassette domain-containing protein [Streptomyces sp. V4-01]